MPTESDVQTPEGVRTYRGRTLEEILPQIREELGPDAIILREREGLVGGVGGFFAQRFIEVEARRGDEVADRAASGSTIDIYDEDDDLGADENDDLGAGLKEPPHAAAGEPPLLPAGDPGADQGVEISARRQTPAEPPAPSEPRPFIPPELQRERIIPRDPQGEPAAPTRRFETDVFLERLREASQILPDEDEELEEPAAAAPSMPVAEPTGEGAPGHTELEDAQPHAARALSSGVTSRQSLRDTSAGGAAGPTPWSPSRASSSGRCRARPRCPGRCARRWRRKTR